MTTPLSKPRAGSKGKNASGKVGRDSESALSCKDLQCELDKPVVQYQ
jgi:hypothetical protein